MILLDVSVLVSAVRRDAPEHAPMAGWLSAALVGNESVLIAPESLGAMVRITTHRKIWTHPLSHDIAFGFADRVRAAPAVRLVTPGPAHWGHFADLCRTADARGNLVSDAWLAALAVEQSATLVTTDRDFARFPGLRWRHPLAKR